MIADLVLEKIYSRILVKLVKRAKHVNICVSKTKTQQEQHEKSSLSLITLRIDYTTTLVTTIAYLFPSEVSL
jgi:hypothetical protein